MKGSLKIGRVLGIDIKLHFTWWFVFIFLSWALATGFFPQEFPGHSLVENWFMGITAALLLFVSVLLHELSHSLVARIRKIKVENITLFFFGGVAGIESEEMKPSSEFLMAIAGPLFSLVLAGVFYLVTFWVTNGLIQPILSYLILINLVLALFNLLPGYPLDGGRAFRALLYSYYHDLRKATKIAVSVGRFLAIFLVIVGLFSLFRGLGNGLWLVFLGGFLYFVAGLSYEQVVLKQVLENIPLKELLGKKYIQVNASLSFRDFAQKYSAKGESVFLVKSPGFLGVLDINTLIKMPSQLQEVMCMKQLATPLEKLPRLAKSDSVYTVFQKFARQPQNVLPVWEGKKLLGLVTNEGLLNRLQWEFRINEIKLKKGMRNFGRR